MPQTKKRSYQQRKKANQQQMQQSRTNRECQSGTNSTQIMDDVSVQDSTDALTDINLHSVQTHAFAFFPVNNAWSISKIDLLKQYTQNIHISCNLNWPQINSPILYVNTSKPCNVWKITGDGNCFFRSLSFLITNSEANYHILRHVVVQAIEECHLPPSWCSVKDYIQTTHISNDGVWSTEVEIMAAAKLLQTDIYTYAVYGSQWKWLRYPASGNFTDNVNRKKRAIYLENTNSNHYDVVYGFENTDLCLVKHNPESSTPKTSIERIQEEQQRQNLWKKLKDEKIKYVQKDELHHDNNHANSGSVKRMQKLRTNKQSYKQEERAKNAKRIKSKRKHNTYSQCEKYENSKRMKEITQNRNYSQAENKQNMKRMKLTRQKEEYCQTEKIQNSKRMKLTRKKKEYYQAEMEQNIKRMKLTRQNTEYCQTEKKQNIKRMKKTRQKDEYSQYEKEQNVKRMKTIRGIKIYTIQEKEKNKARMAEARTDPQYVSKENIYQEYIINPTIAKNILEVNCSWSRMCAVVVNSYGTKKV
ncbi:uncharacterized protein [Apostichopus japonicus]|uniref:uncharacterized protein n=1 Tax=Stichopus japonicus TaxID=307972 RepID=UPI003AB1835F